MVWTLLSMNILGRQFYKCGKPQGQGCNYFMWADGVENSIPSASQVFDNGGRSNGIPHTNSFMPRPAWGMQGKCWVQKKLQSVSFVMSVSTAADRGHTSRCRFSKWYGCYTHRNDKWSILYLWSTFIIKEYLVLSFLCLVLFFIMLMEQ